MGLFKQNQRSHQEALILLHVKDSKTNTAIRLYWTIYSTGEENGLKWD